MNIYDKRGWLNIPKIVNIAEKNKINFIFIIGARGTGKTYGIFKHFIDDLFSNDKQIVYMRRTSTQLDKIITEKGNPWIDLNNDLNKLISFRTVKGEKNRIILEEIKEDGKSIYRGEAFALTTMMNNRGFAGSDFTEGLYDEFIPEQMSKRMKGEEEAFLNAIETISRNRELQGKKAFRWWLASNSNTLDNPIINAFGLLPYLERMKKKGQEFSLLPDAGVMIILINKSPISKAKEQTALYKAINRKSDFARMALDNDFAYDDTSALSSEDLREYKLICTIGEVGIYEHKSKNLIYACEHISGTCKDVFENSELGKNQFKTFYCWIENYQLTEKIRYQNMQVKFFIENIFK